MAKKFSWQEKTDIVTNALTDKYLRLDTKLAMIYLLLINRHGKIEDKMLKEDFGFSDYRVNKIKEQLQALEMLSVEDI